MKKLPALIGVLLFGFSVSMAFAQTPPSPPPGAERHPPPRDCSKAPDEEKKARCEAHQKAMEKCKGMAPDEHRKCMMETMPKPADKKP